MCFSWQKIDDGNWVHGIYWNDIRGMLPDGTALVIACLRQASAGRQVWDILPGFLLTTAFIVPVSGALLLFMF